MLSQVELAISHTSLCLQQISKNARRAPGTMAINMDIDITGPGPVEDCPATVARLALQVDQAMVVNSHE